MPDDKKIPSWIYKIGFVGVVAAALAYVFLGADLIPDQLGAIPPTQFLAWMDDAVVVFIGIFITRKWWKKAFPNTKELKINWPFMLVFAPAMAIWLWYVFLGVDLIPDGTPWAGWFDDAAAFFLMMYVAGKIKKFLWGER